MAATEKRSAAILITTGTRSLREQPHLLALNTARVSDLADVALDERQT
jgi:hypothetical protein